MSVGSTNRLSQLEVLKGIGRNLLTQFLAFFQADLAAKNTPLPDPQSPDDTYFAAVASLFSSSQPSTINTQLPPSLIEALHQIDQMAEPTTAQTVAMTLGQAGVPVKLDPAHTAEHHAVQLWIAVHSFLAGLEQNTITLEPLRDLGADALHSAGIPSISKVTLRKVAVDRGNAHHEIHVRKADDIFASAAETGDPGQPIPPTGKIISASFSFHFVGATDPHKVKISPPKTIKLEHPEDSIAVGRWLLKAGFLMQGLAA